MFTEDIVKDFDNDYLLFMFNGLSRIVNPKPKVVNALNLFKKELEKRSLLCQ